MASNNNNARKALTAEDVEALKKLHDTIEKFHHQIKQQASAANSAGDIVIRKQFEKYLKVTSRDLGDLYARIQRADMAIYRKETKALAAKIEGEEEEDEETES
jgi:hypothetical protein